MANYLTRKPGESTWYARMQVPPDVRHAFGNRSKLIKTTGTSDKAEAKGIAMLIAGKWKAEIAAARAAKKVDREEWRQALHGEAVEHEQRVDAKLITVIRNPPKAPENINYEHFKASVVDFLSHMFEVEKSTGAVGLAKMAHSSLFDHTYANDTEGVQAADRFFQYYMTETARVGYSLTSNEVAEAKAIISKPNEYKPASPITTARLVDFCAYRVKAGVAAKTIDQQESKLKKLSQFLRAEGKSLNAEAVSAWLDTLGLTSKTKAQYLLAGSSFWKWACKYDARWRENFVAKDNPFTGHELPKLRADEKAKTKRKAYTIEELVRIYEAARAEGKESLCDLITLGFYTGARIEELAKLRAESIITVEGVRTIDIDEAKSYAGVRQVPIHPLLAPLIDRLIKANPDGYLLPSSGGNKYGIRSDPLSKAFGRLKTSLGFGRQHVFHSVRSTTITMLLRAGVPGSTVANIVGHETGLVTFDVYDEGASPKQKLDALSNLVFNFIS
jgi:integrase